MNKTPGITLSKPQKFENVSSGNTSKEAVLDAIKKMNNVSR